CYISSFHCSGDLRLPHSFPTRRSSDLKRIWVPLGTKDFASFIPQLLSEDVDAIYLGLGGADAVNFLNQYQQAGGNAHLIGGSIRSEEHTSELQSLTNLVCRLLLEKKKP